MCNILCFVGWVTWALPLPKLVCESYPKRSCLGWNEVELIYDLRENIREVGSKVLLDQTCWSIVFGEMMLIHVLRCRFVMHVRENSCSYILGCGFPFNCESFHFTLVCPFSFVFIVFLVKTHNKKVRRISQQWLGTRCSKCYSKPAVALATTNP